MSPPPIRRQGGRTNSRPNYAAWRGPEERPPLAPSNPGKVERFHQTLKKWLRAQPTPPATIADLQALLDTFADQYNHRRPHRSLPHRATPAMIYNSRPKATPGDRTDDTHERIRRDRVDKSGKITLRHGGTLYSIGIGRTHARTRVIVLVQDLDIRIIDAATGTSCTCLMRPSTPRSNEHGGTTEYPEICGTARAG